MTTLFIALMIIVGVIAFVALIAWICNICEEMFGDGSEYPDDDLSDCR